MAQSPARPLNGGQPSGLKAPLCLRPTGHIVAPVVFAPGPRVADGLPGHTRCGGRCQRVSQHSHNWKTNILFLRCTFQPAHTRDGTCETTSLSAWREENSLPNKSRGTFPKHTRGWQGAKGNALPRCMQCPGRWVQGPGGGGGHWFLLNCRSGCPEGHVRAQGNGTTEHWGPHSSAPAAPGLCYRCWLPEKRGSFWGK